MLGLFPVQSSSEEITQITHKHHASYHQLVKEWKTLERKYYRNTDPTSTPLSVRQDAWYDSAMLSSQENSEATSSVGVASRLVDHSPPVTEASQLSDQTTHDLVDVEKSSSVSSLTNGNELATEDLNSNTQSAAEVTKRISPPSKLVLSNTELSSKERTFLQELLKIDKDIPRCDRDYE